MMSGLRRPTDMSSVRIFETQNYGSEIFPVFASLEYLNFLAVRSKTNEATFCFSLVALINRVEDFSISKAF